MKNLKLFTLFALITAALLFMFSCNKVEITNNPDDIYDEEKTDSSGLLVKEKTYPYGENDVLLLSVNNPTDKNLSVTINVSYFDADKNLLKEDVRTYDQMYSGGGNNFIFNPEIGFDSYSYSISTEEYNGTVIAKDVGLSFSELYKTIDEDDEGEYAQICTRCELSYNGNLSSVWIGADFLIIDKNGELNGVYNIGTKSLVYSGASNYKSAIIFESETTNISIPEELNGNISIIYDFTKMKSNDGTQNNTNSSNNENTAGLPDGFVIEEKEYKVEDITYSLIYIKNGTDKDYKLSYRTFTYENGNSLGSNGVFEFGNYPAEYENYFWLRKYIEKDESTLFEYKYEFFVSDATGDNNLHFDFDNASRKNVQNSDGEKTVIVGTLSPKYDISPNNILLRIDVIGIDKNGNVCCMGEITDKISGNIVPKSIELNYVDSLLINTAVEDMDYIVAIGRALSLG